MKKNLFFVGLMLALSLSASAQYDGFSFGLRLGPNFNWVTSKAGAADNQGTKAGFDLGFMAEYYFSENYALVTGVNVNFLSGHYVYDDMRLVGAVDTVTNYRLGSVDRNFKTTVYEIPLMFKMVTPELGNIPLRAYAQVGGAFGVSPRVKAKDVFSVEGVTFSEAEDYSLAKGEYNPIHASLRAGIGADYAFLESTRVFLGVYYSYDFLNGISSGAQGITSNYRRYYNGNKALGERDVRLDIHPHRIGIEVGVLF